MTIWAILSIACQANGRCEPVLTPVPLLTQKQAEQLAQELQKAGEKAVVMEYGTLEGNKFYRPGEEK